MVDCKICGEDTENKEEGLCLPCQQVICQSFGLKVEFLDEDPFIKFTPEDKGSIYDFVNALSRVISLVDYNYFAINHHSHGTKEVETVEIEEEH